MRFRSRRSINGVITSLVFILIALLVLGIVTKLIVFYILFGILLFFIILSVVLLFNFLKKTGQETSSTRRSTYDILEGRDIKGLKPKSEKESASTPSKSVQGTDFCESCGMRLEDGSKFCSNCGKTSK